MSGPPAVSLDIATRFAATIERRRLPLFALLTATVASLFGRQIATIAIPWAVYAFTGSLVQSTLTAACLVFPWLLTDPAGNAVAARIGHKPASIAAGIVGGATVAAMPLLDLAARLPIATMLLVVVIFSAITALGSASRYTLMPEAADLAGCSVGRIESATQTVARVAIVVGTLLTGLGITELGQEHTLGIAAAFCAIAAAADLLLVSPAAPVPSPGRSRSVIPSATSSRRPAGTLDQP